MNSKVRALQRCLSQEMCNVSPHAVAGLELVQLFYFLEYLVGDESDSPR